MRDVIASLKSMDQKDVDILPCLSRKISTESDKVLNFSTPEMELRVYEKKSLVKSSTFITGE